ncbi:MAG TPA: HEAT repeat domain-containing protein [Methylomirabilota bacterium]|jgi:hypothetical protein|nr:HEAT repeat domain-containing protein [Methylomirabilota bacterium]
MLSFSGSLACRRFRHEVRRLWPWIVLSAAACLGPGATDGQGEALTPDAKVAQAARGRRAVEVPAWAVGPWRYYTVDGRPGGYATPDSLAMMDGSGDWATLLVAADPRAVAMSLAGSAGDGMIQLVEPGAALPRLTDAERAVITAPAAERTADGGVRFTAFYAAPPSMMVQRLEVRAPPGGKATFTRTPIARLAAAASGADDLLRRLATPDPSRVQVVEDLAASRDPRAAGVIAPLLQDGWADLRKAAAQALAKLRDPATAPALAAALRAEKDAGVAVELCAALGATGGAEARAALQEAAERHADERVRNRARYEASRIP